jgi:hypothetical protein
LSRIFGDKVSQVVDWICSSSGVGKSGASSLLGLVAPVVLGFLGKEVKGSHLGASGLTNLLSGRADFLKNAAPAGLAGVLGLSNLSDLSKSDFSGGVANTVQKNHLSGNGCFCCSSLPLSFSFCSECAMHPPLKKRVKSANCWASI